MSNIQSYKIFLKYFSIEELKNILNNSSLVAKNSIAISIKDVFFELSASDKKLEIFCYTDGKEKYIEKDEFMTLYKNSTIETIKHIYIDD